MAVRLARSRGPQAGTTSPASFIGAQPCTWSDSSVLILFDIDGTLLSSERAGVRSLTEAGVHLFGDEFTLEGIPIGGRLDPLIWNDAAKLSGIDDPDAHADAYRETYFAFLRRALDDGTRVQQLPGVPELLEALAADESVTLGLVTGNWPESGRMKLVAAGIDPDLFTVAAWGHDGAERADLPKAAIARHNEQAGSDIDLSTVILLGDTVHDVTSARAAGCRVIAVKTGSHGHDDLAASEPDLLLDDLAETDAVLAWMRTI